MCYTCDVLCVFTVIVKTAKQCIVYGYGTTCPEIQESMERSQNTEYHVPVPNMGCAGKTVRYIENMSHT